MQYSVSHINMTCSLASTMHIQTTNALLSSNKVVIWDSLYTTKIIRVHLCFCECQMFGALSFCFMSCMLVYFHAKKLSVTFMVCSMTHCLPFLDMFVMNQQ